MDKNNNVTLVSRKGQKRKGKEIRNRRENVHTYRTTWINSQRKEREKSIADG